MIPTVVIPTVKPVGNSYTTPVYKPTNNYKPSNNNSYKPSNNYSRPSYNSTPSYSRPSYNSSSISRPTSNVSSKRINK